VLRLRLDQNAVERGHFALSRPALLYGRTLREDVEMVPGASAGGFAVHGVETKRRILPPSHSHQRL
jgi:hypothetical protein